MENRIKIQLLNEHRGGVNSTSFTGRQEGKDVRKQLKLDQLDEDDKLYVVTMPSDTTSFNPSFFLGLFYDSMKKLSWERFNEKYIFDISDMEDSLEAVIKENLEECYRKAKIDLQGLNPLV